MTKDLRFVTYGAELRGSEGDEGALVVDGRVIGYGKVSLPGVPFANCREMFMPGSLTDSLASGRVVLANYNHEHAYLPLGSTKNGSLVLHDIPSSGIHFELRLDPKVSQHRDIHQLVKNGTVNECSFEFGVPPGGDEWTDWEDPEDRSHWQLRSVKRAELYAITLTPTPAYSNQATFAAARSLAYALGPIRPTKPLTPAELRALKQRLADISVRMTNDAALDAVERSKKTGWKEVRIGPGEADVRFEPMTTEEFDRHLRARAEAAGAEIRQQVEESDRETGYRPVVWDTQQRCYVPVFRAWDKQ